TLSTFFPYTSLFRSFKAVVAFEKNNICFGFLHPIHSAMTLRADSIVSFACLANLCDPLPGLAPHSLIVLTIACITSFGLGKELRSEEHTSELQSRFD